MSRTLKISITSEGDNPMTEEEREELVLYQTSRLKDDL